MLNEVENIENKGFAHRFALFLGLSAVDLEGSLMSDIFRQDRLLINGVEMKINLTYNRDAFSIMVKSRGWKVHLLDAYKDMLTSTDTGNYFSS